MRKLKQTQNQVITMNKLDIRLTGTCDEIDEFTSFLESVGERLGAKVSVGDKYYPQRDDPLKSRKYLNVEFQESLFRNASNGFQDL